MQRKTGTSFPSALPVSQKCPLNEPEINFSFFIFQPPGGVFSKAFLML